MYFSSCTHKKKGSLISLNQNRTEPSRTCPGLVSPCPNGLIQLPIDRAFCVFPTHLSSILLHHTPAPSCCVCEDALPRRRCRGVAALADVDDDVAAAAALDKPLSLQHDSCPLGVICAEIFPLFYCYAQPPVFDRFLLPVRFFFAAAFVACAVVASSSFTSSLCRHCSCRCRRRCPRRIVTHRVFVQFL